MEMKLTSCSYCKKTYPKAAMHNKDYCSTWCIEEEKTGLTFYEIQTAKYPEYYKMFKEAVRNKKGP